MHSFLLSVSSPNRSKKALYALEWTCFSFGMKPIQLQLSDPASAVLVEMARRGNVEPEAIAQVCIEQTLAQAIDLVICEDADWWYMQAARKASETCRKAWRDVGNPGSYDFAMGKAGRLTAKGSASV
jgi:hypothetical protein